MSRSKKANVADFRELLELLPIKTRKANGPLFGRLAEGLGVAYDDVEDLFTDRRIGPAVYQVQCGSAPPDHWGPMTLTEAANVLGVTPARILSVLATSKSYTPRRTYPAFDSRKGDWRTVTRVVVESAPSKPPRPASYSGSTPSKTAGPQQALGRGAIAR